MAAKPSQANAVGALAAAALSGARRRLAGADPVSALIRFADATETAIAAVMRGARRVFGQRGIGLTKGLAWRGLAAMTGIGLAAALVTAVTEAGDDPSLASLTIATAQEARAIRDVRQEPRPGPLDADNWVRIVRPVAMFALDSPELDRQSPAHEAHRSQAGPRRQDSLSFGAFAEAQPHLDLRFLTGQGLDQPPQPFVIGLVREAASRGMSVQRSSPPTAIETRFGAVETSDVTLSDGQASRPCIAFRKSADEMPLELSGWWCGAATRPADRQQLVCLIDRIDLVNAADDRALRQAFARTELKRKSGCAQPRLSASGRKTSWLDADGQAPALKTAVRR
jgi:hypothetical protein